MVGRSPVGGRFGAAFLPKRVALPQQCLLCTFPAHPFPRETLGSKWPKPCSSPVHACKCTGVPAGQGGVQCTPDYWPLYPTAAQEAGLCGEGGKTAAGADTAAGGLWEEGADGAAAAHTPGARAGLAEDAAGEDRVIWAAPQQGVFGVGFNRDDHLQPCQVKGCLWVWVVGLSS